MKAAPLVLGVSSGLAVRPSGALLCSNAAIWVRFPRSINCDASDAGMLAVGMNFVESPYAAWASPGKDT